MAVGICSEFSHHSTGQKGFFIFGGSAVRKGGTSYVTTHNGCMVSEFEALHFKS